MCVLNDYEPLLKYCARINRGVSGPNEPGKASGLRPDSEQTTYTRQYTGKLERLRVVTSNYGDVYLKRGCYCHAIDRSYRACRVSWTV